MGKLEEALDDCRDLSDIREKLLSDDVAFSKFIDIVAERAAEQAVIKMKKEVLLSVGETVLQKVTYILGLSALGLWAYFTNTGKV